MYPDPLASSKALVLRPTEEELAAVCAIYPTSRHFEPGHVLVWALVAGAAALGMFWASRAWSARKRAVDGRADG